MELLAIEKEADTAALVVFVVVEVENLPPYIEIPKCPMDKNILLLTKKTRVEGPTNE